MEDALRDTLASDDAEADPVRESEERTKQELADVKREIAETRQQITEMAATQQKILEMLQSARADQSP